MQCYKTFNQSTHDISILKYEFLVFFDIADVYTIVYYGVSRSTWLLGCVKVQNKVAKLCTENRSFLYNWQLTELAIRDNWKKMVSKKNGLWPLVKLATKCFHSLRQSWMWSVLQWPALKMANFADCQFHQCTVCCSNCLSIPHHFLSKIWLSISYFYFNQNIAYFLSTL